MDPHTIVEMGKEVYYKAKSKLLQKYPEGSYVAIEVGSKKYFVGENSLDAIHKAKKKFPKKQFYLARLGPNPAGIFK